MNTVNDTRTVRRVSARSPASSVPNRAIPPANTALSNAASSQNTRQPASFAQRAEGERRPTGMSTFAQVEHGAVLEGVLHDERPQVARGVGGISQRAGAVQLAEALHGRKRLFGHASDLFLHRG